jgi:hypothetical protein
MGVLVAETVRAALAAFVGVEWGKDAVQYKNLISNDQVVVYDLQGRAVTVRAPETLNYTNKLFSTTNATCAVTGTAIAGGVTEAQIVNGGETLILTLTNGTWAASGSVFNALRQSFLDGLVGTTSGTYSWLTAVIGQGVVSNVVRTSDTIVTITLPAAAAFGIVADETVSITIPANSIVNTAGATVAATLVPITAPTFVVTSGIPTVAITGTLVAGGVTEAQVVTGGETGILTITGGTWAVAAGGVFDALRQSLIDAFDGSVAGGTGWDVKVKQAAAVTTIVRTSNAAVTFTTPAAGAYAISGDETVTITVPSGTIAHSISGALYPHPTATSPTTFTITNA